MYRFQILPNGFNHVNCHAVARLLICLCIGGNGKKPVNLIFRKTLQPQALSGHQAANPPATCNDSLAARSVQRMGKGFTDSPTLGIAAGITELDGVSGSRFLIALLGGLFYEKHTGHLGTAVGHPCLSIVRGQAACILSQLGLSSAEVYKHCVPWLILLGINQIQPGLSTLSASAGGQGAGDAVCILDSGALGAVEDLNKSFSICAGDR